MGGGGNDISVKKLVNSQLYENATISFYIYKSNQKYLKFNWKSNWMQYVKY